MQVCTSDNRRMAAVLYRPVKAGSSRWGLSSARVGSVLCPRSEVRGSLQSEWGSRGRRDGFGGDSPAGLVRPLHSPAAQPLRGFRFSAGERCRGGWLGSSQLVVVLALPRGGRGRRFRVGATAADSVGSTAEREAGAGGGGAAGAGQDPPLR